MKHKINRLLSSGVTCASSLLAPDFHNKILQFGSKIWEKNREKLPVSEPAIQASSVAAAAAAAAIFVLSASTGVIPGCAAKQERQNKVEKR